MKRIIAILLTVIMVLTSVDITVFAEEVQDLLEEITTYSEDDFVIEDGVLIEYNGTDSEVVIPNGVTSIRQYAFRECMSLINIEIPDSVTSIGDYAFEYCRNLETIKIPSSVVTMGRDAFYGCTNLTSVELSENLQEISDFTFQNCTSLTTIEIPKNVTRIGEYVFYGCSSLTDIIIPDSVTSIGAYAFYNTKWLENQREENALVIVNDILIDGEVASGNVIVPNNVTYIAGNAFWDSELTEITIPSTIMGIGSGAFFNCSSLTSINIPNSVTTLEGALFHGCSSLTNITIPNNVTSIGDYTFCGCSSLKNITIPNNVTSIGEYAFYDCSSLESLEIPSSVTSIGTFAFGNCISLETFELPSTVRSVGDNLFGGCTGLKRLIMPSNAPIATYGFYACENLTVYYDEDYYYNNYEFINSQGVDCKIGGERVDLTEGDTFCLGSYPQSRVTDENLIAELNACDAEWLSYDYYDSIGVMSDYMQYKDVTYNANKYRAVRFSSYRPNAGQSANGFAIDTVYWFLYEPLTWKLIDEETGLAVCEKVIDSQAYHHTSAQSGEYYANLYERSDARMWILYPFFYTAFTSRQANCIKEMTINNDAASSEYSSAATKDLVFLLSKEEVDSLASSERSVEATDYAKSQGARINDDGYVKFWLTRTAGSEQYSIYYVQKSGSEYATACNWYDDAINGNSMGARPAIYIDLYAKNPDDNLTEKNTQYSIKIIDSISKKPLSCNSIEKGILTLGNGQTFEVGEKGSIILDLQGKFYNEEKITISVEGYKDYTGKLSDLDVHKQNIIEMESSSAFDSIFFDLTNFYFGNETLYGPTVNLLGREMHLFTLDIGIDLSKIPGFPLGKTFEEFYENNNIIIDQEEKVIKIMLGVGDGYKVSNVEDKAKDFEKFKDYYKSYTKTYDKQKYKDIKNKYNSIRDKLDKFDTNLVFSCSATLCGYLEIDYSSGKYVFKEGGLVLTAEAGIEEEIPLGTYFYATFGLEGTIEGKPYYKLNDSGKITSVLSTGIEVSPSVGIGAKLFCKDIASATGGLKGKISGELSIPAESLAQALTLKLGANFYVRANLFMLETKAATQFPDVQLYPRNEANTISLASLKEEDSWTPVSRDYLYFITPLTVVTDETENIELLSQQNIYPYASPKLTRLEDGRIFALWLQDDGTKTDNNRTTLYFSIYENDSWSVPSAVYESGKADYTPQLVVDGNTAHILWQRATQVFGDEYDIDMALANTELVYCKFEDGVFSEPMVISANEGLCQLSYEIASKNDVTVVTWMENSDNNYNLDSGTTNIYSRTYQNGAWGEITTIKSDANNIDSYSNGFVNDESKFAYTIINSDSEEQTYELYIGDECIQSSVTEISALTYQNDRFYWIKNNKICYYDGTQIVESGIECMDSNYKVISENGVSCIVFKVDDGFVNELYISYEKDNQYTNSVALTDYKRHISKYDVVLFDGNVLSFMAIDNLNENEDEFPYTTTDLVCEVQEGRTDISMRDYVIYDEETVVRGETVTFKAELSNLGTKNIDTYQIDILDIDGNVLATQNYTDAIGVGEAKEVTIDYVIPEDFIQQEVKFVVSTENDSDVSENEVSMILGKADVVLNNCVIEDGIIQGNVSNNGTALAEEIVVQIYYFGGEKNLLESISLQTLGCNENADFQYQVSDEYSNFEEYYLSNRFIVSVTSSSEESNYVNNECDVLIHPIYVNKVSLNTTKVSLRPNETVELTATIQPLDALEQGITWISDATDVATVDENGVVTAVGMGEAIITVITQDGDFTANCKVVVSECEHKYSEEWTVDVEPTQTSNGMISRHCLKCDARTDEKKLGYLNFASASLTLYDNLAINYKVSSDLFAENGYENPYVKFNLNGKEITVDTYRIVDDKYVFDFKNIAPNQMNDTITATLYATFNGMEYSSEPLEYSVASYCYNMLRNYSTDEYAELRTLLVDLLNYGTDSQIYTKYNLENLVNASLTDEQMAWGTATNPELTSVTNIAFETIESPAVTWLSAGLNLKDSVTMRFKLSAENIEDLVVKITSESGGEWTIANDRFSATDGGYYVYFNGFNAGQMSEPVYVTVYDGETAVSNTLCYSIESYAYAKKDAEDEKLVDLVYSMMKYGNSAYEYVH